MKRIFAVEYFRRESPSVVVKIRVMPWDRDGKKHFEEQGYTRKFPLESEE